MNLRRVTNLKINLVKDQNDDLADFHNIGDVRHVQITAAKVV
jgi:hypothetical protein